MMQSLIPVLASLATLALPQSSDTEQASWRAAAAWSLEHGGVALVVRRGGAVVFEDYAPGHGADRPFMLHTGCAGMWAVATLAAEQQGLLALDERVSDTIEEWRGVAGKQAITVRQLLSMESGLAANDRKLRNPNTNDRFEAALDARMIALPGETFRFGPVPWYVLGALLERKLAEREEDALAFLQRSVFDPIGLEVYYWGRDRAGNPEVPSGAFLTAREWSKFGQLVLDGGRAGGQPLVATERLAECFRPSRHNPTWGLGFWLVGALDGGAEASEDPEQAAAAARRRAQRATALPRDIVFNSGLGYQRLYVIPSRDMVVVRQGLPEHEWSDVDFLRLLLGIDPPVAGGGR